MNLKCYIRLAPVSDSWLGNRWLPVARIADSMCYSQLMFVNFPNLSSVPSLMDMKVL